MSGFVKSLFDGYKEAKVKSGAYKKRAFEELDQTPFLFSSDYLNELYNQAEEKEDYESILDHLYRHDAVEVDSYANIEKKIIDKYWR